MNAITHALMKTLLGYLIFAALLTLCYIEKINAEAAKSQARSRAGAHVAAGNLRAWEGQQVTMAQLRE